MITLDDEEGMKLVQQYQQLSIAANPIMAKIVQQLNTNMQKTNGTVQQKHHIPDHGNSGDPRTEHRVPASE
jgi:hypothetical protein